MDAYLLRRLLANLLDSEKEKIIEDFRSVFGDVKSCSNPSDLPIDVEKTSDSRTSVIHVVEKCVSANGEGECRAFVERNAADFVQAESNPARSKKKSKRDRRRLKVRAMKVAEDSSRSSEVDDVRLIPGADASPSSRQSESAVEDVGGDMTTRLGQKYGSTSLTNAETQALRHKTRDLVDLTQ